MSMLKKLTSPKFGASCSCPSHQAPMGSTYCIQKLFSGHAPSLAGLRIPPATTESAGSKSGNIGKAKVCRLTQVARDPATPGGQRRAFCRFGFGQREVRVPNAGSREHTVRLLKTEKTRGHMVKKSVCRYTFGTKFFSSHLPSTIYRYMGSMKTIYR